MSKSAKKRAARLAHAAARPRRKTAELKETRQTPIQSGQAAIEGKSARNVTAGSKQSRVIALLSSAKGATIAAIMQATGWQQHSVRGFLAGVIRNRLKLNLTSRKIDGNRVYRITHGDDGGARAGVSRRPAA
jgi:hypothetical protein